LCVITGLSGSGKSSLAFDTIYAEGQRRYVESLSAYARQFLGQMEKPDVDLIEGLSPAISIDQKGAGRNPRSTVGTVTEIYDYLRLLFARVGHPHCPNCGREIARQSVPQIVERIQALPDGTRILVLGPLVKDRKTEGDRVFEAARKQGYVRVRVDGELLDLDEVRTLDKYKRHTIEAVVDRLVVRHAGMDGQTLGPDNPDPDAGRLADSVETALRLGEGTMVVAPADPGAIEEQRYSELYSCPFDGTTLDELEPRSFSFNSPHGACSACTGLGVRLEVDPERVVPNRNLSVREGALVALDQVESPPVLMRKVDPKYPPLALKSNAGGTVTVNALISEKGDVLRTEILRGVKDGYGLESAAETAIRLWKFRPARKDGVNVRVWKAFDITFKPNLKIS